MARRKYKNEQHLPNMLSNHKALMNIRHNYIAHAGDAINYEYMEARVVFEPIDDKSLAMKMGYSGAKAYTPANGEVIKAYENLVDCMLAVTQDKIAKVANKLLAEEHKLTKDEIAKKIELYRKDFITKLLSSD